MAKEYKRTSQDETFRSFLLKEENLAGEYFMLSLFLLSFQSFGPDTEGGIAFYRT